MARYSVIVPLLNQRKSPVEDTGDKTNVVGVVNDTFEFEGEFALKNKIGDWYKDLADNFYWGGGVRDKSVPQPAKDDLKPNSHFAQLSELIDWNLSVSQIPEIWKKTKGAGVKIAVIDTGIFENHEDLQSAVSFYQDFTVVKDKVDFDGHGTHVSGIIGARSPSSNGIIGVAPLASLIILKVLPDGKDGGDMENYQTIIDALDIAVASGADIINISLSLKLGSSPSEDLVLKVNELRNKLKEITDKNIIVTAAAGDNANLRAKQLFFPADCSGVISVASINEGFFERNPDFSDKLTVAGPTINYVSTFKSPLFYERFGGCSMTTAFMSGIIALAISFNRKNAQNRFSKAEIVSLLNEHSLKLDEMNYGDNKNFFYHILNQS